MSTAPVIESKAVAEVAEKKAGKKSSMAANKAGANSVGSGVISTDPCSGTRDFFPEDMRLRKWLNDKWMSAAKQFGFQEYDSPVLEAEALWLRKAGEDITNEMFNFVDKEGSRVTLRPEITPQLVRMVLSKMRLNGATTETTTTAADGTITKETVKGKPLTAVAAGLQMAEVLPLKWTSIPQCWRFETTQRGRKREHFQWNCDIVGVQNVTAELELIACMVTFFQSVGLTPADVGIRVNSRKILGAALEAAGVSDSDFAKVCVIVDKIDKIGAAEVVKLLVNGEVKLPEDIANRVVASVSKDFTLESNPDLDGVAEMSNLFNMANSYGIKDWIIFDASVVRGLAYYTGIVWEAFDRKGVLRAIAGGGRYDGLFSLYGAPKTVPCVGFGLGDCVIHELLKERNLIPNLPHTVDFVVAAYPGCYPQALQVARGLRASGSKVDMYLEDGKKIANVFKFADKVGARMMAFVAPGELEKGMVRIKDLRSGGEGNRIEKDVPINQLEDWKSFF